MPAQLALVAPAHPRSSRTVMPQTPTAAMETTLPPTKATAKSTASKPSLLSTASSSNRLYGLLGADYPSHAMGCWIWPLRASCRRRLWLPRTKVIWYFHFKLIIMLLRIYEYCERYDSVHLIPQSLW